ncbi:endonuclease/exonuclease/phosphatase family protein [Streptomyces litchfieldiae]|uniref:Endonuclease/exonuclease/phosphatase family protein n=1 Tax=Streptomyces litchfieldiae TaxID=3075543 RepID=A0ABU2MYL2_9ACTN|nr:endonuclease/exonuclease/phosphatase family protein [Streptomyces sp. DSM 44938]MDT0346746.1 endonuclease/exonuclease/phosphatase family protein [Streptomyces sp. DSM 44938]
MERNGLDAGSRRRRDVALEVMEHLQPDILFRQEESAYDEEGRLRDEEAHRLGMESYVSPLSRERNSPTATLIRPGLFQLEGEQDWHGGVSKPVKILTVRMRGTTRPLKLTSLHLWWCDPILRATTARRVTSLADKGEAAVLFGGDMNSYPHRDPADITPLPNWDEVPDRVHYEHRTIERDGERVSDTLPDEILTGRGVFVELGHYAYTELRRPEALAPTATLWRTDQGPGRRIDRLYASPDLAPALLSLEVIDNKMVRFASDHALVVASFDLDTFRGALTEAPRHTTDGAERLAPAPAA